MTWFVAEYHNLSLAELDTLAGKRGIFGGTATAYDRELVIQQLRESDRSRFGLWTLAVSVVAVVVGLVGRYL